MKIKYQIILVFLFFMSMILIGSDSGGKKIGPRLQKRLQDPSDKTELVWVFLRDKGNSFLQNSLSIHGRLTEKALKRRAKGGGRIIDDRDYPVYPDYISRLSRQGFVVRNISTWLNAVSGYANAAQIDALSKLDCVQGIELVAKFKRGRDLPAQPQEYRAPLSKTSTLYDQAFYGPGYAQVNQIHVPDVHRHGVFGQGVTIAMLDNGFRLLTHHNFDSMRANIIATKDFVDHKTDVAPNNTNPAFGSHGIYTLSTIGGYAPTFEVGPAFRADFILARTENDSSETPVEEDNWIAGMQWADSLGADIISSSLGYVGFDNLSYYDWTWMNGDSTVVTRGANIGVSMGLVIVNSAGNEGFNGSHNTLIAPADGDSVIAAGAVDVNGTVTDFSSNGPTTRGRIKPDVMAMGSGVAVASAGNPSNYTFVAGTSFSCPLTAGVCALILTAHPDFTPAQVRWVLTHTADRASSPDSLIGLYGYGIINALTACAPLPSQILSATPDSGKIVIKWTAGSAINFLRYRIYRSTSPGTETLVDSNAARSDTVRTFSGLNGGTTYYYRVTVMDGYHLESALSNEASAVPLPPGAGTVQSFVLQQNFPNPFNPGTNITYDVFRDGKVKIIVYNCFGQKVRTLIDQVQTAAKGYTVHWDGRDESGSAVSSGVYLCRMTASGFSQTRRMLLVK